MPDTEVRKLGGKALILATAEQAAAAGWEPRPKFNVVSFYREAFEDLMELTRASSLLSVYARKADRRTARMVKHDLYKVGMDMTSAAREWEWEVDMAAGYGADWTGDLPADAELLLAAAWDWARLLRPEVAINAAGGSTVRRASLLIRCCMRLEIDLTRQFTDRSPASATFEKCLAPVARSRVGVAADRAPSVTRDVPGEDIEQGEIVEAVSEGERVRVSEDEGGVSTARTARTRRVREGEEEDDGWDV